MNGNLKDPSFPPPPLWAAEAENAKKWQKLLLLKTPMIYASSLVHLSISMLTIFWARNT